MLYCIISYFIILYYIISYNTILYNIILYHIMSDQIRDEDGEKDAALEKMERDTDLA